MDRKKFIDDYGKREFSDFLSYDHDGIILKILDDDGCEILKESRRVSERIEYILCYSKFCDELFKNDKFLDIFLGTDVHRYYNVLRNLKDETYERILSRCLEVPEYSKKIGQLIGYFNDDFILKTVKNWKYSTDDLYKVLLTTNNVTIINEILKKDNIDLSDERARFDGLIEKIKSDNFNAYTQSVYHKKFSPPVIIPRHKINNKLYKTLWERHDIFELRNIVNTCDYVFDTEDFNNYIRKKEDEEIDNYLNNGLFSQYKELFEACKVIDEYDSLDRKPSELEMDNYKKSKDTYYRIVREDERLYNEVHELLNHHDFDGLHEFLSKESEKMISNYIIDYHFRENYYNTVIDLKELLDFYYAGNVGLPMDRVSLYYRLLNIDYLSFEDKLELHNELKEVDIMSMFYDDMAYSRELVGKMLKENSLAKESIVEYKDEELSKKYGVDVYKIDDNPFFAIVKNGRREPEELPAGHSFSLIGCGGIGTFVDPKISSAFVYDAGELNPKQIVHMFPFDSFTLYKPYSFDSKPTERVNTLLTPEELMHQTTLMSQYAYNEVLLLESGTIKTGMDASMPVLHKIALFCIDEIREKDIKEAKENGVGIFLVDSKNFDKGIEMPKRIYRHDIDKWNENYYSDYDKKEFEEKRQV